MIALQKNIFGVIYERHFEQFTLSHNYTVKIGQKQGQYIDNDNIILYELYSENNKNQVRKAFVEYEKYVCSCGSYKRNGLICRHVFAIANVNQDKSLAKFVINQRWETPLLITTCLSNAKALPST